MAGGHLRDYYSSLHPWTNIDKGIRNGKLSQLLFLSDMSLPILFFDRPQTTHTCRVTLGQEECRLNCSSASPLYNPLYSRQQNHAHLLSTTPPTPTQTAKPRSLCMHTCRVIWGQGAILMDHESSAITDPIDRLSAAKVQGNGTSIRALLLLMLNSMENR